MPFENEGAPQDEIIVVTVTRRNASVAHSFRNITWRRGWFRNRFGWRKMLIRPIVHSHKGLELIECYARATTFITRLNSNATTVIVF